MTEQPKTCYNCASSDFVVIHKKVREDDTIDVIKCKNCGLVTLSNISKTDEKFYIEGKMLSSDGELSNWRKNTQNDDLRRFNKLKNKLKGKAVVDFGCGNAGFLKLLKNENPTQQRVYGVEVQKQFKKIFAQENLNIYDNIDETPEKIDFVTMFHVLEHLDDPLKTLKAIANQMQNNGELIIEIPHANDLLLRNKSYSDFVYWRCHVFLYTAKTISQLLQKSDFKIKKINYLQRYNYLNHLHWIFKGKPNGHNLWKRFYCPFLNSIYTFLLKLFKVSDTFEITIQKKSLY